jgi:hypothetical protein
MSLFANTQLILQRALTWAGRHILGPVEMMVRCLLFNAHLLIILSVDAFRVQTGVQPPCRYSSFRRD